MANGVMIYDDTQARLDPVPVPDVPRAEVIDEFYDAVVRGKPPLHDGTWSMATLEVCLAILQSAKTRSEVPTKHQIAVRA
jgi:phthalate 4,5-cis-dihydrodiol dehydrogenase